VERQVDQEQKPRERSFIRELLVPNWWPTREQVLWTIRVAVIAVPVLIVLWVVLGTYIDPQNATDRKDHVQTFALVVAGIVGIVGAIVSLVGLYFSRKSLRQQRDIELTLADESAQNDALQAYFEQMGTLLADKSQPLHRASGGERVSTVARAQTLTVLHRLDGERKANVVQFLYESGLITKDRLILDLRSADLSEADLRGADLRGADLSEADLRGADLSRADLSGANLSRADLRHANLNGAYLTEAHLRQAVLSDAHLREARLGSANLSESILIRADLSRADLLGANLSRADLRQAFLSGANLRYAHGYSLIDLVRAESLEGATMPNGQKYEDWLKDKEGRGEDGENSGTS
jgi:uncharacterized protein YjbI with pentapeptide repeats